MNSNLIARASISIKGRAAKVWMALVDPAMIKEYMFGSIVSSAWKPGSAITWKGVWNGKEYEDKGKILEFIPNKKLKYSHFSPLAGLEDKPENYHNVTIDLNERNGNTLVTLEQDNNPNVQTRDHSEKNWTQMLEAMKKMLETQRSPQGNINT